MRGEIRQKPNGKWGVVHPEPAAVENPCRHHTHHRWVDVGRAPDYGGVQCRLWRCERCGKERELFVDVKPWAQGREGSESDEHALPG